MNILTKFVCGILPFLIIGCDKDESIAPAIDAKHVNISVIHSSDVSVLPIDAMYRSKLCRVTKNDSNGREYMEDGYNSISQQFLKNNASSKLSIPIDGNGNGNGNGNGDCDWKLSNVTVGFKYNKEKFRKDINESIKNSIILVFDDNLPQNYNGNIENSPSEYVNIKRIYFPWVDVDFMGNHGEVVRLTMLGERNLYTYRVKHANSVTIDLISNYDSVVYSEGPKKKSKSSSNYTIFKYPDGSTDSHGKDYPDFEKLLSLSKDK